jgi:hypothetical protein
VVLIAFCFGTPLEALAGFGARAAITAIMLVALGIEPIWAAALALIGNTAAVSFGALAIPITTLSDVTGLDADDLGAIRRSSDAVAGPDRPVRPGRHGRWAARDQAGLGRWRPSAGSLSPRWPPTAAQRIATRSGRRALVTSAFHHDQHRRDQPVGGMSALLL